MSGKVCKVLIHMIHLIGEQLQYSICPHMPLGQLAMTVYCLATSFFISDRISSQWKVSACLRRQMVKCLFAVFIPTFGNLEFLLRGYISMHGGNIEAVHVSCVIQQNGKQIGDKMSVFTM